MAEADVRTIVRTFVAVGADGEHVATAAGAPATPTFQVASVRVQTEELTFGDIVGNGPWVRRRSRRRRC